MLSTAEVDVVCNQIYKILNRESLHKVPERLTIKDYMEKIPSAYPKIPTFKVSLPQYGISFCPWDNWAPPPKPPFWWEANNKAKHERHEKYKEANLENALRAFSGLFVMVLYLYKDEAENGKLFPKPKVLRGGESFFNKRDDGYRYDL